MATQWLQSERPDELFRGVFIRLDPSILDDASPLIVLSVSAAVTENLSTETEERLEWLGHCIDIMSPTVRPFLSALNSSFNSNSQHTIIQETAPHILDVIGSRLTIAYSTWRPTDPQDAIRSRIMQIGRVARELKEAFLAHNGG